MQNKINSNHAKLTPVGGIHATADENKQEFIKKIRGHALQLTFVTGRREGGEAASAEADGGAGARAADGWRTEARARPRRTAAGLADGGAGARAADGGAGAPAADGG